MTSQQIEHEDDGYDRARLALYLTGLLPNDPEEGEAVLDLCKEIHRVAHLPPPQPSAARSA